MAKKFKFEKYRTTPFHQEKELRRLAGAVIAATPDWVESGKLSPETANHRISCIQDLLARLGLVPAEGKELEQFNNPPMQTNLFS